MVNYNGLIYIYTYILYVNYKRGIKTPLWKHCTVIFTVVIVEIQEITYVPHYLSEIIPIF